MPSQPVAEAQPVVRWPLAVKLALALAGLVAVLAVVLLTYVGPRTSREFAQRCEQLVERSREMMHQLAADGTRASCEVLVDVITHTNGDRARALQDLPLAIYGTDIERLRTAILAEDEKRSSRLRHNVETLAAEMQRRAAGQITDYLVRTTTEQRALATAFGTDLRTSLLGLCAIALGSLFAVLGFGLFRFVVRPAKQLRSATQRVAQGHLDVDLAVATDDEIGALATDFAAMVQQLRSSRAELQHLNEDLEREVARKTQHLQQALADLQRTHRQLVQTEKMASIGTLAGGIAHEFNNLIGGIRGCAAEARSDEPDPVRAETLDVILRAADRASTITNQLLRFARRSVEHVRELDASTVLTEALALIEPLARRHLVTIERAFPAPLPLRGDPDALHQVFVNLFTNALQAMPAGGQLRISAARTGSELAIAVADSGVGIAKGDLDRVFEPFFTRRANVVDPEQRGTGLGLSVSYGIVTAHGGRMTVTSTEGEGATFTVWLPAPPPSS